MHDGRVLEVLEFVGRRRLVVDAKVAGAFVRFRGAGAGATLEDMAVVDDMVLFSSLSP